MTWLLILMGATALGAFLLRGRWRDRAAVLAVAGILVAGMLGYALTGRPDLPARPAARFDARDAAYTEARALVMPAIGEAGAWLTYADALSGSGDTLLAIRGLERALADRPRDAALWTGLGEALARHGDGHVGPAARFAFDRATALAPRDPAPRLVLGLALLRDGDPAAALAAWAPLSPLPGAPWADFLDRQRARARAMISGYDAGRRTPGRSAGI